MERLHAKPNTNHKELPEPDLTGKTTEHKVSPFAPLIKAWGDRTGLLFRNGII